MFGIRNLNNYIGTRHSYSVPILYTLTQFYFVISKFISKPHRIFENEKPMWLFWHCVKIIQGVLKVWIFVANIRFLRENLNFLFQIRNLRRFLSAEHDGDITFTFSLTF
uniref:Uncharacterized protein n=1 Tax=Cacopsylla melanoneura TaxID=428564 RepID=A0A8D8Q4D0_9HEMI